MWLVRDGMPVGTFEELERGSDRTVAIVAATIVESAIVDAIQQDLCRDASDYGKQVQADAFSTDGVLGSFGARISLAYLLGYLTPQAHTDLLNLKYLRNRFAHYAKHHSFHDQKIKDRCANFRMIDSQIQQANAFTFDREGAKVPAESVSRTPQYGIRLHVPDHKAAIATARGRYVMTAKLLCVAFTPLPIGEPIPKPAI
jgi:DNA-binding MltR family transcriptional regulator